MGELVFVDRTGQVDAGFRIDIRNLAQARVSPDSRRLAVERPAARDGNWSINVFDLERGGSPVIVPATSAWAPVWAGDNRTLFFSDLTLIGDVTANTIWRKNVDSAQPAEKLYEFDILVTLDSAIHDISPDGTSLLYGQRVAETGWDIWELDLKTSKSRPVVLTPVRQTRAI